ncbi:MAG: hypothetical protein J6T73_02615, partial [Clostridia bacterium]|nr:hypothetical protein [Clostridia bacterium]
NNIHLRAEKTDVINLSGFSAGAEVGVYVKGLTASSDYKVMTGAQKADIQYLSYDIPDEAGVLYCDGAKDWVCVSGETVELTGTHHTHEAGTVWASAAANPAACVTADNTATAYSEFGGALTAWADGATLKLTKDVTVSSTVSVPSGNHTLDLNGYGLKMTGSGSVISVGNGAKLSINDSNPDTQHKFTVSDEKSNGAGLATVNDSLTSGYKTFKGGYITGGNADNGGGIYIDGYGEVIMNGGALIGNHAADNGAGIRMESYSSFTLNGGEIAYNQASVHGGGLGLAYTNHTTITVNGGEIHHNICEYAGGAITLDNDPDSYFYLYGGAIRDNASVSGSGNNPWHPGGIAGNGNVHIKGGAQVYNNINLSSSNNGTAQHNIEINTSENDLITLDGPLSEGARIAVSYHTGGEKATGVFTLNWSKYMGDADPADYFVSDYDEYIVRLNNGEAEHTLPPVASITSGESTANYSSFSDAVSAWTAGSTLKLMTDVTTGSTVSVPLGEHTLDLNGYGIKMTGSGSVISVPNGATLNLNDSNTSATHKFSLPDGAGLATLDESNGNYVISGGYITGGNAQPYGGGVFVAKSGILNMYDGTIIGNNASSHGGGVSASAAGQGVSSVANFKMFGGAISYNTANWGGGVAVYGNVYTYNNAVISANTASAGGGIELESNGKLYMNGGTVT